MLISDLTYKAIEEHRWDDMVSLFSRMNSLQFRRVQTEVRSVILPKKDNASFWEAYYHLVKFNKPAFLACIVAMEGLAKSDDLDFCDEHLKLICLYLQSNYPEAVVSMVKLAIPCLRDGAQITGLMDACDMDYRTRLGCLLNFGSLATYHVMFEVLRHLQDDKALLEKCCRFVMKKGDDMSLNMAYLVKVYFGLHNVNCTRSTDIQPYELSYVERDHECFNNVLLGKRPKI